MRIVLYFSLVNTEVVVTLRLAGKVILIVIHLSLVIAGVVVAGVVIVRLRLIVPVGRRAVAIIRKAIVVVVIVRVVPGPPRIKSRTEDHPRSVNEAASVTIPPMVTVTVPVAMPIP